MTAVLRAVFLNRVIGQMHEVIVQVLRAHRVGLAGGPQIALAEKINVVVLRQRHPNPNVELALVHEQGPLDVLLNYECLRADGWLLVSELRGRSHGRVLLRHFRLHNDCLGGLRVDRLGTLRDNLAGLFLIHLNRHLIGRLLSSNGRWVAGLLGDALSVVLHLIPSRRGTLSLVQGRDCQRQLALLFDRIWILDWCVYEGIILISLRNLLGCALIFAFDCRYEPRLLRGGGRRKTNIRCHDMPSQAPLGLFLR